MFFLIQYDALIFKEDSQGGLLRFKTLGLRIVVQVLARGAGLGIQL